MRKLRKQEKKFRKYKITPIDKIPIIKESEMKKSPKQPSVTENIKNV